MNKDLTTSEVARKNVLNNPYALTQLESNLQLRGLSFQATTVFTKLQAAEILDIDERTIDRYLSSHSDELKESGYQVIKGRVLRELRLKYVDDTNVVDIINPKTPSLGIFSFRAVLNLAMLVTESQRAKAIRSRMLDIVIDVIAEKTGGKTKYINQRDQDFLPAAYMEDSYRRKFTDALKDCLDMGNHKYAVYTDKIYKAVFCENAGEYKKILRLVDKDKTRDTMYAEVLKAIASFEHGLAVQIREQSEKIGRKLKPVIMTYYTTVSIALIRR
ncbi:MAG: hypothetical protein ACI8PB_004401 [Desulforhopalus sp.]|jgi:hypothetical protein